MVYTITKDNLLFGEGTEPFNLIYDINYPYLHIEDGDYVMVYRSDGEGNTLYFDGLLYEDEVEGEYFCDVSCERFGFNGTITLQHGDLITHFSESNGMDEKLYTNVEAYKDMIYNLISIKTMYFDR